MSAKHNARGVFLEVFFLLQCSNKFVPFSHRFFTNDILTSLLLIAFLINKVNGTCLNLKTICKWYFLQVSNKFGDKTRDDLGNP